MDYDEFANVERFLEFIEQWTEERFIKENERTKRESQLWRVKSSIKQLKKAIEGKEK